MTHRFAFPSLLLLLTACAGNLDVGASGDEPANKPDTPDAAQGGGARPDGEPPPACTPIGDTRVVAQIAGFAVNALATDGDTLWLAGRTTDVPSPGTGAIYRVATRGGTPERVVGDDYVGGRIGVHGNRLVYIQGKTVPLGSGWAFEYPNVLLRDKTTGTVTTLENPRTTTSVDGLVVHATGIYWHSREYDARAPSSMSRWNPVTQTATELTTLTNYSPIVVDGVDLFYTRLDATETRFEAVAIGGGPPRVLRQMPYDATTTWRIVAADASSVYYTKQDIVNGGTIGAGDLVGMNKDGTGDRVVVARETFSGEIVADDDAFYFQRQDDQETLRRVSKQGGPQQTVWTSPNRYVQTVVADTCNVYWATVNPPAVYGRSR